MKQIVVCLLLLMGRASAQLTWESRDLTLDLEDDHTVVERAFAFSNTGRYPVAFQSIQPGCPCTTAKADRDVYAPGEKGILKITYDPKRQLRGVLHKSVAVETLDETGVSSVTLTFAVTIPQIAKIEPLINRWTEGDALQPKITRITFPAGKPVKILGQMGEGEGFKMEIKVIEAGRVYEVMVTPASTASPRNLSIRLMTDVMEESNPKMPLMVCAEARVEPKPGK